MQVRCPGCSAAYSVTPAFYHGIGYEPDNTYCFVPVIAGSNDLGGPVVLNSNSNQKYVFTGSSAADFSDPSKWSASNADAAGTPPSSLGYVNSTLYQSIMTNTLNLPCCNYSEGGEKRAPAVAAKNNNIRVYPNPTAMDLNFEFPNSGDVTIKLTDQMGRVMDKQVIHNNRATFNVKGYKPGLYLYQVITNGKTLSGKILIE